MQKNSLTWYKKRNERGKKDFHYKKTQLGAFSPHVKVEYKYYTADARLHFKEMLNILYVLYHEMVFAFDLCSQGKVMVSSTLG